MNKPQHHHLHVRYQYGGAEMQIAIPISDNTETVVLEFYSGTNAVENWETELLVNAHNGALAIRPVGDPIHAIVHGEEEDFPGEEIL